MGTLKKSRKIHEKLDCIVIEGQSDCLLDCKRFLWTGNSEFYDKIHCKKSEYWDSWLSAER